MVPWVLVYGINTLLVFAGSIVLFYVMPGAWKTLGLLPMFGGIITLMALFAVVFFIIEQRADLDIYMSAQAREGGGVSAVSSWYPGKNKYAKLQQNREAEEEMETESSPMWLRTLSTAATHTFPTLRWYETEVEKISYIECCDKQQFACENNFLAFSSK